MIRFEGLKPEAMNTAYPMLPAGPYIGKIFATKIDGEEPNQSLILRLDITEGEHTGYFKAKYEHDKAGGGRFEPKYRGDYKLRIPHPQSGSQYPESDKRKFNDTIWRIEQSNPGYRFDGDETKLAGKTIGISIQEGTYNDKPFTAVGRLEIVDDVRKGLVKVMNPRKPAYSPDHQAETVPTYTVVDDAETPFF